MARKSLADRIREEGTVTQSELDKSKGLAKKIAIFPEKKSHKHIITDNITDNTNDIIIDAVSDNISNNITNKVDNNINNKVTNNVNDSKTKSVIKSVAKDYREDQSHYHREDQSVNLSVIKSVTNIPEPFDIDFSKLGIHLTDRQLKIYEFLKSHGTTSFIQATYISKTIDIPIPTVRNILKNLKVKGILTYKRYQKDGRKGIVYALNPDAKIENNTCPSDLSVTKSVISSSVTKSVTSYNSSSSSIDNTTTKNLEQSLNTNPELGYWRQKGLTGKQITQWINTAQCTPELMIQYLCYCKFDMVDLGNEKEKNIKDVFNWFYRIIEKSGQYRKPTGYKSHQEKQLEAEKQLIADREKRIQELKELHRKKYEQERDLAFWEMMSDPDGDLYKQCFASLSDFAKRKAHKGGKAFESAMRKAFDEIEESSDNT